MSSLKIIGLLHFLKFLGLSAKNYNPQSLMITLYFIELFKPIYELQKLSLTSDSFFLVEGEKYINQLW